LTSITGNSSSSSPIISPRTVSHMRMRLYTLRRKLLTCFKGNDCFTALGWFVLMGVPLVFLIRKFKLGGGPGGH